MPESTVRLAEKLSTEGYKSIDFFQNIPVEQWNVVVYSDQLTWSLQQLLAHFVSSERANLRVIKNIVLGGPGSPENFDINEFNHDEVDLLQGYDRENLLKMYAEHRSRTTEFVRGMADGDLEKIGRHPYLGETAVVEIVKLIYRHNQIHLRDARKVLNSPQEPPVEQAI